MRRLVQMMVIFVVSSGPVYAERLWTHASSRLVHLAQEDSMAAVTAVHEAGHIVANKYLKTGLIFSGLGIGSGAQRGSAVTFFEISEESVSSILRSSPVRLLVRRAAVLMAGGIAERAFLMSVADNRRLARFAGRSLQRSLFDSDDRSQVEHILGRQYDLRLSADLRASAERLAQQIVSGRREEIQMSAILILENRSQSSRCTSVIRRLLGPQR